MTLKTADLTDAELAELITGHDQGRDLLEFLVHALHERTQVFEFIVAQMDELNFVWIDATDPGSNHRFSPGTRRGIRIDSDTRWKNVDEAS